jgi:Na+/melibiose symporter-like transporter
MTTHTDHAPRMIAAWGELGQRMAQRQSVIQIYMTVVIATFGFYYSQRSREEAFDYLEEFFLLSVTMITVISSVLIGVHDRVIVKLKQFLATCEQQAFEHTPSCHYVFYFSNGRFDDSRYEGPSLFHSINQYAQKIAFLCTMVACNAVAIVITAPMIDRQWIVTICVNSTIFSAVFLLFFERIKMEETKTRLSPTSISAEHPHAQELIAKPARKRKSPTPPK